MPITEKQRELRKGHIGASDMAAILGLDPFRNAYDVWLEKTDKLKPVKDDGGSQAMYLGNTLETGVLAFAEDLLGKLRRNQYRAHPTLPLAANLDALVIESNEPVEAKTTGLQGPVREFWGEDGTDHVPDRVIVQAHVQMLAMTPVLVPVVHVAALIGWRGFAMFHIPRNEQLCDIISNKADEFWSANVQADIPPAGCPSLELAKIIKREPKSTATIAPELVANWLLAKQQASAAESIRKQAEAELMAALGTSEAGIAGELGAVTYYEQTRKSYTVKESTYRVLRHNQKGL